MFNVIVDYIKEFHVLVKDLTKIDSFVRRVKYNTYTMTEKVTLIAILRGISSSASIIQSKVLEVLGVKVNVFQDSVIASKINTIENIKEAKSVHDLDIPSILASVDRLYGDTWSTAEIKANPLFAYFRKLVEFDSLSLEELNELTLEEMDFIMEFMN